MSSLLRNGRVCRPMVVLGVFGCALVGRAMADSPRELDAPEATSRASVGSSLMARAMVAAAERRAEAAGGAAMCFVENPTPEQLANIMNMFQALPPTLANSLEPRYRTAGTVWVNNGAQGSSNQARAANLTYSFPADGVAWGDGQNGPSAPNNLHASLQSLFGSTNEDRGLELIRQGLCSWRRFGGLTYTEIADNNSVFSTSAAHVSTRGDIRIGSNAQGTTSGVLAYNQFPTGGSDMTINSDWFPASAGALGSATNNYRYLRDVVSHEHGHGLGFIHPVPCDSSKLMEPFIHTNTDGCLVDEFRGMGRNYGDRRSGNSSGALATDWGNLTTPVLKSVIERNLSTNGSAGANGSGADWFKFTIDTAQTVAITVNPTGGSYTEGQQSSGCNGTTSTVVASQAGNLNVELRSGANGASVLQTADTAGAGAAELLGAGTLGAGTYWVRVFDAGPNANQTVQLYDLTMRVGTAKAPPVAVAGLHKRIQAGKNCFFFGNINSYATDTGPTGGANSLSYFWDLDGNGTFGGGIDSGSSQPVVTGGYPSNGTYPVTLRVTDSNGLTSTDTINVVVFGATATITGVSPSSADPGVGGATVPVTITGANLRGVTSAGQFEVSGTGVSVIGTPVVNALGTQVTGLSFVLAAGASGSARDVSVTNSDGSGTAGGNATGIGRFTVNGECTPPVVLAQPQSQAQCPGGAVTFNVGATAGSGGPLAYQWRKNAAPIDGATGSVLSISNLTAGDSGAYDCVVSNPCGPTVTDAADLSVDASGISDQPSAQTACLGGSATFTIGVGGTADLQWRKDGADIVGATGPSLVIDPVEPGDAGVYDCAVLTACDLVISDPAALTIGGGVSVQVQPVSASVCEGSSVVLTFGVSGATGYQWRKGGEDIPGATSSTLEFQSTTMADAGAYDCVVASECGGVASSVATLGVCSAVSIGTQPVARVACPGSSATFTVGASGSLLAYQWRRDGEPIEGATGPSLVVSPVGAASAGLYDCVVENCCQRATSASVGLSVCVADYNCSGTLTVEDIFDYLNGWLAVAPAADVNGVDGVTVQDIFDFLNSWLAGC